MPKLKDELTVKVHWANQVDDSKVLCARGEGLPLSAEAVVGPQEVHANTLYELCLKTGPARILHVSGAIPSGKTPKPEAASSIPAEAWVRCQLNEEGFLSYEIHIGRPGMDQPKATHRGRIQLQTKK